MRIKPILISLSILAGGATIAGAATIIGEGEARPFASGGSPDGWSGVSVLETAIIDSTTVPGVGDLVEIMEVSMLAGAGRAGGNHHFIPLLVDSLDQIAWIGPELTPTVDGLNTFPITGADPIDISTETYRLGLWQWNDGQDDNAGGTIAFAGGGGGGMFYQNLNGTLGADAISIGHDVSGGQQHASGPGGRDYHIDLTVSAIPEPSDPLPPTDISLSNSELLPGSQVPTDVGIFNTADPNPSDNVFTYQLVSGAGDTDNALFAIAGPRLETATVLGGAGNSYSIRIRSTDPGGLSLEKSFSLSIVAGQAPTGISLSTAVISTDAPSGATVGLFDTSDADAADVHTYTLVSGVGDANNGAFAISGDELRTAQALPAGSASLSLRVRSTDLGGFTVEETFVILVIDPSVRISEFMASNSTTLLDDDGDSSDWIEIVNDQAEEVNLSGWYLTDDANNLTKWQFPSKVIPGGGYLVVFASNKDRAGANDPKLHTNFQLTSTGEYLALVKPDGQTIASFYAPTYPPQTTDVSYGVSADGSVTGYFSPPTPEEANGAPSPAGINTVEFSVTRGFFDTAFDVTLTPAIPGSTIRYTTSGSKPTTNSGTVYSGPITISRTSTLRAISYVPGGGGPDSLIATHTYVFVADVVRQGNMWSTITQNANWGPRLPGALTVLPTISLVKSGSISQTESETSMELIFPDGTTGFQVDCGVEHFGGHSLGSPKKNMRMSFKEIYGPSRLNYDIYGGDAAKEFDQIILRTGSHDTWFWTHPSGHGGTYIRGRWAFDRQLEAGHVAPRGRWVHVYINGSYHGMHHLMERPNGAFMASYLGGEKEDYEALNAGSPIDGDKSTWNAMKAVLSDYGQLKNYMDVKNYADYMLLQFYGGNDWDWNSSQNWSSASREVPDASYKFFAWDSDVLIRSTLNANVINRGGPENMWGAMKNHDEFKLLLADRAHEFFFNDGMLTRDRVLVQFDELTDRIDQAIIAECARWGNNNNYTPATWQREVDEIKNDLIDQRTDVVIAQMRAAGVFPSFDAPLFSQLGGQVPDGFHLTLSLPGNGARGRIYYTFNGGDPTGNTPLGGGTESVFLDQGVAARALIPSIANGGDSLGDSWKGGAEPFDDSSWLSGTSGIGYDTGSAYDALIGLDVEAMQGVIGSAYARIPFDLTQAQIDNINQLRLDMKAEDGFVAYLNGVEVASLQKPSPLLWNSNSDNSTSDGTAVQFQTHDITQHIGDLVAGSNILAFHLLNHSNTSSDLLCLPRLVSVELPDEGGNDPPGVELYTGPITLTESGTVRARVQLGGQWSALEETFFYVEAEAPAPGELVLTEINYNPQGADDAEFLELKNVSAKNLILDDLQFTDGISFTFPVNTVLPPGEYVVVVGNETVFAGRYLDSSSPWISTPVTVAGEFTGSLDNGGENLTLVDASGGDLLNFAYNDSGSWPGRADGKGSSAELERIGDLSSTQPELNTELANGDKWRPSSEFHGSPGRGGNGPDNRVVFNELLARSNLPATDWFELYNTTLGLVDLSGWFISDDNAEYKKFEIPGSTNLEGGMFLVYEENDFNAGANLIDFALNGAKGDDLYLLEADAFGNLLRFVDRAEFGAARSGESLGRWPDGTGDLYPMQSQTPGQPNSTGGNYVRVGSVVVSEVMYNPSAAPDTGLEFIEIHNTGASAENLANWRLRGEAEFDFAAENLGAGAVLLILGFDPNIDVAERNAFLATYPSASALQLRGPWSAGLLNLLDNGGARIVLQRADDLESPPGETPFYPALFEDTVNYNDVAPWPTGPDGTGPSLSRISAVVYGDDPANWQSGTANPGVHATGTITYELWAAHHGLGVGPEAAPLADFELDGVINLLEFALDSDPTVIDPEKLPTASVQTLNVGGQLDDYLALTYRRRRDAPNLVYTVQVSHDLVNWSISTQQVGNPVDNGDGTDSITVRDTQPIGASGRRFMRLLGDLQEP